MLSCKKTFALCATAAMIMSSFSEVESTVASSRRSLREDAVSGEGYHQDSHLHDGILGLDLGVDLDLDLDLDLEVSARLEAVVDLLRDEKAGLLNDNGAVQHQNGETPLHSILDIDADIILEIEAILDLLHANEARLLNHHGARQHQHADTPSLLGDSLVDIDAAVEGNVKVLGV